MVDQWWMILLISAAAVTLNANSYTQPEKDHENKEIRQVDQFTEEEMQDINEYLQTLKPEDLKYMSDEEKFDLLVMLSIVGPDVGDLLKK
uniref:Uncharacterized protein n=1 Tax=Strigamia maritima TaxID=126957 RepID=T1JJ72_STRMM